MTICPPTVAAAPPHWNVSTWKAVAAAVAVLEDSSAASPIAPSAKVTIVLPRVMRPENGSVQLFPVGEIMDWMSCRA